MADFLKQHRSMLMPYDNVAQAYQSAVTARKQLIQPDNWGIGLEALVSVSPSPHVRGSTKWGWYLYSPDSSIILYRREKNREMYVWLGLVGNVYHHNVAGKTTKKALLNARADVLQQITTLKKKLATLEEIGVHLPSETDNTRPLQFDMAPTVDER